MYPLFKSPVLVTTTQVLPTYTFSAQYFHKLSIDLYSACWFNAGPAKQTVAQDFNQHE